MSREQEETAQAETQPVAVPPEWKVTVRRIEKEDGRYLIYYEFEPSAEAPEIELQPQAEEKA